MKMTNKELLEIALQQSAYDCNSKAEVFLSERNIVTISKANPMQGNMRLKNEIRYRNVL